MTLPLDTAPGSTPDEEAARNWEISRHTLSQAREELDKGDLLQASEKAWCAAAYAVKAVAEQRRWFNDADWRLGSVVEILSAELADLNIRAYYLAARDAHYNFYHHEYERLAVAQAIDLAGRLINQLEVTLAPEYEAPYVGEEVEELKRRLEQPTSDMDRRRLAEGRTPLNNRPPVIPRTPETAPDNGTAQ